MMNTHATRGSARIANSSAERQSISATTSSARSRRTNSE
jgi:hypothetical protein